MKNYPAISKNMTRITSVFGIISELEKTKRSVILVYQKINAT